MTTPSYTFVILRYRHDQVAGELLNVGVVVHSAQTRFLGARFRTAFARFRHAYPDLDTSTLRADVRRISKAFAARARALAKDGELSLEKTTAETLAREIIDQSSAFVWSSVGSGIANDPKVGLDAVYDRFVTRFDEKHGERRSDQDIWRPFRDRLAAHEVSHLLEPITIRSNVAEVAFDHAWKNGTWHCVQPLSFDLASADSIQDKAARWAGNFVGLAESQEQFRAYLLVGAPSNEKLVNAYRRALSLILQAPVQPRIIQEGVEAQTFADEFAARMAAHSS